MDSLSPRLHLAITSAAVRDEQHGEQEAAKLDATTDSPAAAIGGLYLPVGGVDVAAGTRFWRRSSTQ
jgi:hypothetical protein